MVRVDWAIEKENEPFKQTQTKRSSFTQHTAAVCSFCMFMKWFCSIEWLMGVRSQWCVSFPLKPTPLSRATGQDRGGGGVGRTGRQAGRLTAGLYPRPPTQIPKQQPTRHKGGGERQHQQYYDWLWWVSICSKKWWRDYRLLFSVH